MRQREWNGDVPCRYDVIIFYGMRKVVHIGSVGKLLVITAVVNVIVVVMGRSLEVEITSTIIERSPRCWNISGIYGIYGIYRNALIILKCEKEKVYNDSKK